jgi:GTPase SAR1 family protein
MISAGERADMIEYSLAIANLNKLVQEFSPLGDLSNEAQTRFSFIDRVLEECLGWDRSEIRVEVYEDGGRTDYECGLPRKLIVEAKHAKKPFNLPPKRAGKAKVLIESLIEFDPDAGEAIRQVQVYGASRGVGPVAVANGPQLLIFSASNLSGKSPLKGVALVFDGYDEIVSGFNLIYEALSKSGIEERRLDEIMGEGIPTTLPAKLSAMCLNYFEHKYSSTFQESLKNAAQLVIEDLGRTADVEKEFLENCYCESGPLTQYSLIGRNLVAARYAALFSQTEVGSRIETVNPRRPSSKSKAGDPFSPQVFQEALARRPIVLVGDVGVGKTTFLKHLMQVSGREAFSNAIPIYFDLGNRATLSVTPKDAFLENVKHTLRDSLSVNLYAKALMEAIYYRELKDYDEGFAAELKQVNPVQFTQDRIALMGRLSENNETHLRLALAHVSRERKCQSIIIIDNADQRSFAVQQEAFLIAQELADSWNSLVFIALRPQTFHASKRSGTLSAYPTKIFVIPPPKLEDAIEKRLQFALKMAQGRIPIPSYSGITLHVDSLAKLIAALLRSLSRNRELYEFIVNVSGGNVRLAIELVSKYLGSPNVESERIVKLISEHGNYDVPLHEFAKAALLSEYSHYQEDSSAATNVFSLVYKDKREHFLSLLILGYLSWDGAETLQSDGFISARTLLVEMQSTGFQPDQITAHLQKLTRRKLIETTERRLLETGEELRDQGLPEAFRISSVGAYHLKKWCGEFAFMEAMAFDTHILNDDVRARLLQEVNDDRLLARYRRAIEFREYLDESWTGLDARPYFDWKGTRQVSLASFGRVERRLRDQGLIS